MTNKTRFVAEFMGTFMLVFFGCGAIVVNNLTGALGHIGVSAAFGIIVMAVIYAVGNISGAHLNPAVTLGFCAAKRMSWSNAPVYVLAQCGGAVFASLVLIVLFPGAAGYGATVPADTMLQAGLMELILSFVLMFVILNVSTGHKEKGIMAGVAVGGTVALEALVGGPISGASMNPARSLGPAIAELNFGALWMYVLVPSMAMLIAAPFCRLIQGDNCCPPEEKPND